MSWRKFQRNLPPVSITTPSSNRPTSSSVRISYSIRPPEPDCSPELHEREYLLEQKRHLQGDVDSLESEVCLLRENLSVQLDEFDVKFPKLDGSSEPLILTRLLESLRTDYQSLCQQLVDLEAEFSLERRRALEETIAAQRLSLASLQQTVEAKETELLEREAQLEDGAWDAMRQCVEGRRQEKQSLAQVVARLRVEEQKLREEAAGTFVAGRDEAAAQQEEIAGLKRKLHRVHRTKLNRMDELRLLGPQEGKPVFPIPEDFVEDDSSGAASGEDDPGQ
jgi:hypothetical protein